MQNKTVLRKNPDIVTRQIDQETMLVPIYRSSDEINCIYSLNKVASRVWKLIDGKKTLPEIKAKLLKEFDTTPKEFDKEMNSLLKDLKDIKAII